MEEMQVGKSLPCILLETISDGPFSKCCTLLCGIYHRLLNHQAVSKHVKETDEHCAIQ